VNLRVAVLDVLVVNCSRRVSCLWLRHDEPWKYALKNHQRNHSLPREREKLEKGRLSCALSASAV
jgi:hypothetical protein